MWDHKSSKERGLFEGVFAGLEGERLSRKCLHGMNDKISNISVRFRMPSS